MIDEFDISIFSASNPDILGNSFGIDFAMKKHVVFVPGDDLINLVAFRKKCESLRMVEDSYKYTVDDDPHKSLILGLSP